MRIALVLLGLAACSSKADPPPPPAPVPIPAPVVVDAALDLTRPCLPRSLADANIAYLRSDGPRVTVCYGNGDDTPGSVTACLVLNELGEVMGPRTYDDAERARLGERTLASASEETNTLLDDELVAVIANKEIHLLDARTRAELAVLPVPGKASPLGDARIARFSDHLVVAHARPAGVFFVEREKFAVTSERAIPICR